MIDTRQASCYSTSGKIGFPSNSSNCYGQDAQYESNQMSYKGNDGGTVSDIVTGFMWSKAVDETKVSLAQALKYALTETAARI